MSRNPFSSFSSALGAARSVSAAAMLSVLPVLFVLAAGPVAVFAQEAAAPEEEEIPEPSTHTLQTGDRLGLVITYYASNKGREAVPVVCLHDMDGKRSDYAGLALALQKLGYAVVTVDLRGHGDSTEVLGGRQSLDTSRMRPEHFQLMVTQDMKAVIDFLWARNNEKELNLNRLCLVGAGMGSVVAINYAAVDWSIPPYGTLQRGQFTKALVLLSPEMRTKGLNMSDALRHPAVLRLIRMLILYGELDGNAQREAMQIGQRLQRARPEPEEPGDRTMFSFGMDTRLQGTKMLDQRLNVERYIAGFLKVKLEEATGTEFEWKELRRPHQ